MMKLRFVPASLAARTVVLVVAVVVIAEFATFSLIFHQRSTAHWQQIVHSIAGQVRLLQTVLPGLDAEARARLAAAEVGEPGLQLRSDGDAVPPQEAQFGFARRLAAELGQRIDGPVTLRHPGRGAVPARPGGLWIGFYAGSERWWLVLPPPRFAPQALPRDFWLYLAATLAALFVVAALFVRSINGPLSRLGKAVAAVGSESGNARHAAVALEGPREVRDLAMHHNTMLEQLASADRERTTMLAGLTHDLRTPLARLRVRLALLERDDERAGLVRDVEDMERIVGQCLAFLRSAAGSDARAPAAAAASPVPLRLADAVSDEVARQRELGRAITMSVSDEAAAAEVAIARGDVQRVIDNLVDNAVQYGAPPFLVWLDVEADARGERWLMLRLRDHGAGIAEGRRLQALEAFVQIEPARATGGSCGLGLAIVRGIVGGCGGTIDLAEADGGGLEVAIRLPLREVNLSAGPRPERRAR